MRKQRGNCDSSNITYNRQYTTARHDLAHIIAQETSGFRGALPDPDDWALADKFIEEINSDDR